ncbi:hypothetical protein CVIRNUC_006484 [Coccomyxa viridis]|uniref:PDZ domain-containing protein n=1 Tax=Coccomyxa viridis TaxID=1274662 RepID=A0AAV1IAH7_9CHLO|nr:hypothetical protein CVIRNUC_006484 [Coccomyxa viridis]
MAAAAAMRTADRASAISYSALPALSTRVVVRGKGNNIIGQRPLLKRAIIARASQQTGRTEACQLFAAPSALGTFAAALTPYVAVLASALVAASPAAATLAPGEILQLQETLTVIWETADSGFVDPIDRLAWDQARQDASEQLEHAHKKEEGYSIMQTMLSTLGDPFTRLLAPSQSRIFQADTTGQVIHIGMQAQKADTEAGPFVRVAFVLTGSPAHKAGLHVGDIVTAINGRQAAGISSEELNRLLRRDVQLLVKQSRPNSPMATRSLYLQARPVEVYPIVYALLPGEEMGAPVGYMAIQSFGTNTGQDAAAALHSLHAQGASAYVIDLRGNSGGLVSAGLEVSGQLLHKDDVFVHVSHRDGYEGPMPVEEEGFLAGSPLAVLVNSGTASTSEMLAATLHVNAHAPLIGEHSYGKGRTQRIMNMKDGATLLVSTSLVTTPAFGRIDKVGLEPDKICRSGVDLPDALKSEPLEEEKLAGDLQADPCVRMAVHALADAPPLTDRL